MGETGRRKRRGREAEEVAIDKAAPLHQNSSLVDDNGAKDSRDVRQIMEKTNDIHKIIQDFLEKKPCGRV